MDIAEDRVTGQGRASTVEQCQCPRGYKGLSCEVRKKGINVFNTVVLSVFLEYQFSWIYCFYP